MQMITVNIKVYYGKETVSTTVGVFLVAAGVYLREVNETPRNRETRLIQIIL